MKKDNCGCKETHNHEIEVVDVEDNGLSCGCEHCKQKANQVLTEKSDVFYGYKSKFIKILIAALLVCGAFIVKVQTLKFCLFLAGAIVCGYELFFGCMKYIIKGKIFNENTLMCIASVTAFILGEYFEGAFIVILFSLGETLEGVATASSRKKISGLAKLKSTIVHIIRASGISDVTPEQVDIGSIIEIRKGEGVPIDGVLIGKSVELDVKAITGESKFLTVENGGQIFSGAINVGDAFVMRTTKLYKDSTVEKIISLVERATSKKAKSQKFITAFAKIYSPIIFGLALLIAFVCPFFDNMSFIKWIYKSLSFLVVSCPCALVISVPLAFFVGIGSLAKNGILIKGSIYIENLAKVKTVVFDKTGTLTNGIFVLDKIDTVKGFNENNVYLYASALESKSNHPIAKVITNRIKGKKTPDVLEVSEQAGMGLSGVIDGKKILVGNYKLMLENGVRAEKINYKGAVVYVAIDCKIAQYIYLSDHVKSNSKECIKSLSSVGVENTCMLSGDIDEIAQKIGLDLGIDCIYSEMLPEEKLNVYANISAQSKGKTMYVGDGINDSPTLSASDVGVAMGGLGSEIAIESADVVIMDDDVGKIPIAIKYAKKIRTTVGVNIIASLVAKFAIMILSVITHVPIWVAMFGDVGVMLLAVLNSLLIAKKKIR